MTINVSIVTSDALVFGCDSIASITRHLIDPFACTAKVLEDGKYSIEFSDDEIEPYVTGAWGNVTKMFPLQNKGASAAAVTCGLARLNDRTMSSFAAEFMESQHKRTHTRGKVLAIAEDFLEFLLKEYNRHYTETTVPPKFWEGPDFLVGGYDKESQFPCLYRVSVQNKKVKCEFESGSYGIAWAGQSDAVERLVRGYDIPLRLAIEKEVKEAIDDIYKSTSDALARILQDVMAKLDAHFPKGVNTELPAKKNINLSWDLVNLNFPCGSWPTQDSIDFAAFLVNMQSARAKFVPGVATVGGRTHIGVITKASGFNMLNELDLKHTNTGFSDDT